MAEKKWKQVKESTILGKKKTHKQNHLITILKEKKESRKSDDLNNIKLHFFRPMCKVKLYHIKFYVFFLIFLFSLGF